MEIPFVVHIYISVKNSFSQNNEINHVTLAHREWELRKSNSTKYIDKHIESTHTHTDTHSHRCCSFVLVSVVFSLFQHFICSDVYCFVCLFWFSFSASITLINLWIQQFVLTCRPVLLLPFPPQWRRYRSISFSGRSECIRLFKYHSWAVPHWIIQFSTDKHHKELDRKETSIA